MHRSGYYRYVNQMNHQKPKEDIRLLVATQVIHRKSSQSYGSRRIAKQLQSEGFRVGRYKARRLMKQCGLRSKQRRRYLVTTQSHHDYPVAPNRLNRRFKVTAPNRAWVSDITYIWTQEGYMYLAAVLDLYSRRVIGWSMASHMKTPLICNALAMAISRRCPPRHLLHHSDRGSQYASEHYQHMLASQGMVPSMSRKGNCWDNAVMERFFGSLKSECTDGKRYLTREEAKADIIYYIEKFYNNLRLHSTLGYKSPVEFEKINACLSIKVSTFT